MLLGDQPELPALHAGGAFDARTALEIARKRGELMAEAADQPGAMLALPANIDRVREVLETLGGQVVVANHNSPKQVVVSGPTAEIDAAEEAFRKADIEPKRLSVATAFHSAVVAASTKPFATFLKNCKVSKPSKTVFANTSAAPYGASVKPVLAEQIANPVRFVEQIEAMYEAGARTFIECGPGNVLGGLTRKILKGRPHTVVSLDRKRKNDVTALQLAIGQLFTSGLALDLTALWKGYGTPTDPASLPAPKMPVAICGANYGQPYPPPNGAADLPPPNGPRPAPPERERIVYVESSPQSSNQQEVAMSHQNPPGAASLWVTAFAEAQQQTAHAHTAYQNAMASSHQAYLRTVETSFNTLNALATGTQAPVRAQVIDAMPAPLPMPGLPATPVQPVVQAAPVAYTPPPAPVAPTPAPAAPAPVVAAPVAPARWLRQRQHRRPWLRQQLRRPI